MDDLEVSNREDPILDEFIENPHWGLPDYRNISSPGSPADNHGPYSPEAVLSATNQRSVFDKKKYEEGARYNVRMVPIDSGGTSKVFVGYDQKFGRRVAIKALRSDKMRDSRYVESMEREAKLMAHIQDERIVEVYDFQFGVVPGDPPEHNLPSVFIIMEYVESPTLKKLLDNGEKFSPEETSALLSELALALDVPAKHGILHKDLKPANIFWGDGKVKIGDFGIASRVWKEGGFGTPAYLSPERIENEIDLDDPKYKFAQASEVFSLGTIVYEMLTGEPFDQNYEDTIQVIDLVGHTNGLRNYESTIIDYKVQATDEQKKAIKSVLDKAHKRNPSERYQTPEEFAQAFAQAIAV